MLYEEVTKQLRAAYDGGADARDRSTKDPWKQAERAGFLQLLRQEGRQRLLEAGAGTGQDSLFFQQSGLSVVAIDLSPEMVARCRAKGLEAHVRDFLHLGFPPASFDAAYAFNCLLHVPDSHFPAALSAVSRVLVAGGLFFVGVYGGQRSQGFATNDCHQPPRFFAFRDDEQIIDVVGQQFQVVDFHVIDPDGVHFQSLTLRKPWPA